MLPKRVRLAAWIGRALGLLCALSALACENGEDRGEDAEVRGARAAADAGDSGVARGEGDAAAPAGGAPAVPARSCDVWRDGPTLLAQRESSAVLPIPGGLVLAVGGHFDNVTGDPISSSELIDVAAGVSRYTGSFNVPRSSTGLGGTVLLADGRVLSAGVWNWPDQPVLPTEIWDPATGEWTITGTQNVPGGPALALPDGRVLTAGGIAWASFTGGTDHPIARSELWDPGTGEWTLIDDMSVPRTHHALVLVGGRAVVFGGFEMESGGEPIAYGEELDAQTGSWREVPGMVVPRAASMITLRDGRLLSAGGVTESGAFKPEIAAAEIFDPATRTWHEVAPMLEPRTTALTLLADGRVLATGGAEASSSASTTRVEIYDPEADTWTRAAPLSRARRLHGAVLLPSGEVIVVGGYPNGRTTEIYMPCE